MAVSYHNDLRDLRLEVLRTAADATSYIRIYGNPRPASANAVATGTLLAELRGNAASTFNAASGGVMEATTPITSATAEAGIGTETAYWFRITDSTDTNTVMDGSISTVAAATGDLLLDSTSITQGQSVAIDSITITEGNS